MNTRSFCAFAAVFLLAAPLLDAAPDTESIAQDTVTLHDGARVRTFVIARDEIGVFAPDGRAQVEKVPAAANAEAVRQRARQRAVALGGKADLILYQQGEPRTEGHRRWATARVFVKVRAGTDAQALATAVGAAEFERPSYAPGYVLFTAPKGAGNGLTLAAALGRRAEVENTYPLLARTMALRFMPNDPFFADNAANAGHQWHLKNTGAGGGILGVDVNVTTAWDTVKGTGVRIGIVDDGLDLSHPDLAAHADSINSFDFRDGDADPSPGPGDDHGTAVAGVAAAIGNNGIGVSGSAPEATLVGLRLVEPGWPIDAAHIAAAVSHRNDIIQIKNNSWGPPDGIPNAPEDPPPPLLIEGPEGPVRQALQDAIDNGRGGKGTLFFWAGGNGRAYGDHSNFDGYANSIYTMAIAAVGDDGIQSDYSEEGANILVAAPSYSSGRQGISTVDRAGNAGYNPDPQLLTDYVDPDYTNTFGGTSAAAPLVAGIGALLLETNPDLTWRDVKEILIRTAVKNDPADTDWDTNPTLAGVQNNGAGFHFNHKYGAGLINAAAAVTLAQSWPLLPPMDSKPKINAVAAAIPDNSAAGLTRTFLFTAAESLRVESVTVQVDITHPRRDQIEVELTSPSGTVSRLGVRRPNDTESNLLWTFSSVRHWGEGSVGVWSLAVRDRVAGTTGTLNSATLTLYGSGAQLPDPLHHSIPAPPVGLQTGAHLGFSLAVDGGYTVVGAPRDDTGEYLSGVVKVFNSVTNALLLVIPNPNPTVDDFFGSSVAISGSRLVVGAVGYVAPGRAYVFDLNSAAPTVPIVTLNHPHPANLDDFGFSVGIAGTRVVVGVPYNDTGGFDSGRAYVFDVSSVTPAVPVATLNNPVPGGFDYFGNAVACAGTRVIVAAHQDSTFASGAGSVYVYDFANGTPTVPTITINNPSGNSPLDDFGYSVAISGSLLVVGALTGDTGALDAGEAYVFDLASGTPAVPVAELFNPSPGGDDGDNFGHSVAIFGTKVIVGAIRDDTGGYQAGIAYVFDIAAGTPSGPVATFTNPTPAARGFGWSVAISGTRVSVGSPYDDSAGSVYVYDLAGGTPTIPVARLKNAGPVSGTTSATRWPSPGLEWWLERSSTTPGAMTAGGRTSMISLALHRQFQWQR